MKRFFIILVLSSIFVSCRYAPEGKGKISIENNAQDYMCITEVWTKEHSEYEWKLSFDNSGLANVRIAQFNLEPGNYDIKLKARTKLFSYEQEYKYSDYVIVQDNSFECLCFDGYSIYKN